MVDIKEVERLQKLSKLNFSEGDKEKIAKELESIIDFANKVNEASSNATEGVVELNENALREDIIEESYPQQEILKNANCAENGFFVVERSVVKK